MVCGATDRPAISRGLANSDYNRGSGRHCQGSRREHIKVDSLTPGSRDIDSGGAARTVSIGAWARSTRIT